VRPWNVPSATERILLMSFSRRPAAGLATVGATVLAALALGGAPATAADVAVKAGHAVVTPSPDTGDQRGNAGYGGTVKEAPPTTTAPAATTPAPGGTLGKPATATTGPTRGRPGYTSTHGESPTPPPGTTSPTPPTGTPTPSAPTGNVKVLTPNGVSSQTAAPVLGSSPGGAGVSSGLPLTGAPVGGTLALGGLMLAGGAAAVWYTRRRRNA
jgi:LPXTG-motif cell wall-anchored protein